MEFRRLVTPKKVFPCDIKSLESCFGFDIPLWPCVTGEDTGTRSVVGTEFPDETRCLAPVGWVGVIGSLEAVAAWPRITTAPAEVTAGEAVITGSVIDMVVISGWEAIKSGWMRLGVGKDGMEVRVQRGLKRALGFLI